MDRNEYEQQLKELEKQFAVKRRELAIEYAKSNNPFKAGDKVTDHIGSIIVSSISFSYTGIGNIPCCVYSGVELTSKGVPVKKGTIRKIWQCNIKEAQP